MKKDFVMHLMRMTMVIVMFFCGAGSAFAQSETQSENDYFSLTKNVGTESESIKYYPTLGDAVNAAAVGDKITLLDDYTITVSTDDNVTTDTRGVSINKSITLDLNDHKIKRDNKTNGVEDYGGALISIYSRKDARVTLTLVDNGADKDKMGSIENTEEYIGHAIVVGNGSTLIAKGVKILTPPQSAVAVVIDGGGTAEFDDCVIQGDGDIIIYGTATITNSDISGGNKGAIQVGEYDSSEDVIREGCLTIGDGVYISGFISPGIDYQFGTVILKALPTFRKNRPTARATARATTRATTRVSDLYDIGMRPGLSLTFEKGTFQTPNPKIIIYIRDNDGRVDPATYTNPITTNYSNYVKDGGGQVIDPNDVFEYMFDWTENFDKGFRLNTAGEVILNHAAATVTSYSGTTTSHYDFSEAIAAAKSGYIAGNEAGGTEFIPEIKLLDDIDLGGNQYNIGDNSKAWSLTLDLNGHTLSGSDTRIFTVGKSLAIIDNSDGDTKGSLVSNYEGTNSGQVIHVDNGELTATGITITGGKLNGIFNNYKGTVTLTGCTVSGLYGIQGSGTVNISGGEIIGTRKAIILSNCVLNLNADEGSAPCSIIGGEYGIFFSSYIDFTLGSGVDISRCSEAGIKLQTNNNLFTALPTFGTGDDKNGIDIWLANSVKMNFSEGSYTAPAQPITIKITNDSDTEPSGNALPAAFTTGYSTYVKSGGDVIDPATVFAYHDASLEFVISNDSGEAAVFATMTFAFAEGQTWMTWCDANTLSKPSGIDAYKITAVTPTEITTTKLTGDVIPAYTPLLLQKNGADGLTAMLIGSPEAPTTGYDAETGIVSQTLTGATVFGATKNVAVPVVDLLIQGASCYVLKGGEFVHLSNCGFAQNRCWLALSAPAGARRLVIVNGEATGVNGVKEMNEAGDDSWYTATGRKLERRPDRKGIYIHRGQKMIIR